MKGRKELPFPMCVVVTPPPTPPTTTMTTQEEPAHLLDGWADEHSSYRFGPGESAAPLLRSFARDGACWVPGQWALLVARSGVTSAGKNTLRTGWVGRSVGRRKRKEKKEGGRQEGRQVEGRPIRNKIKPSTTPPPCEWECRGL